MSQIVMSEESHVGGPQYRHDSRGKRAAGREGETYVRAWSGLALSWHGSVAARGRTSLNGTGYGAVAAMEGDGCDIFTLLPVRRIIATGTPSSTVPFFGVLMFFSSTGQLRLVPPAGNVVDRSRAGTGI